MFNEFLQNLGVGSGIRDGFIPFGKQTSTDMYLLVYAFIYFVYVYICIYTYFYTDRCLMFELLTHPLKDLRRKWHLSTNSKFSAAQHHWGVYLCHGASCHKSLERRGPNPQNRRCRWDNEEKRQGEQKSVWYVEWRWQYPIWFVLWFHVIYITVFVFLLPLTLMCFVHFNVWLLFMQASHQPKETETISHQFWVHLAIYSGWIYIRYSAV